MRKTFTLLKQNWRLNMQAFSAVLVGTVLCLLGPVKGQVTYNEPFAISRTPLLPLPTPPAYPQSVIARGWSQGKFQPGASSLNVWDVMNTTLSANPVAPPNNIPAVSAVDTLMRFASFDIPAGEAAFLASKRLDMRNNVAGATLSFWMYRGTGFPLDKDRLQVFVNDSAVAENRVPINTSQELLATTAAPIGETTIHRNIADAPVVGSAGWYQYTYTIPNTYNTANTYVMFVGFSEYGDNIYIDDVQIQIWPNAQTLVTAPPPYLYVNSQNTSTTAVSQTNQDIIGLKLTMDGLATPRTLTNMAFNTNGSTNPPTDISNAKLWFTGGTPLFSTANAIQLGTFTNPWATNFTFLTAPNANYTGPANFAQMDHGDNYFWITYDIAPGGIGGNNVDAEWIGSSITGSTAAVTTPSPQTLTGNRKIDVVYCQPVFSVGTAWAGYQTNDFIQGVTLIGDGVPTTLGITNVGAVNTINAFAGPLCPGPFPAPCEFQSHPPDYENFNPALLNKTTTLTTNGTTQYPIVLKVGTYNSGNAIAAWIDYNGDGIFNNYFDNIRKTVVSSVGSTITLANVSYQQGSSYTYGLNIGMTVYGTNIPVGTTITGINVGTRVITLSNPTTGAVSGLVDFVNESGTMNRGEKVAQSGPLGASPQALTNTFRVPTWAAAFAGSKKRMRVREVWINYNIDPCAFAVYGETEDYTVTVIPDCPAYTGPDGPYKTWLGYTNNWSDPTNWCPVGAPIQGATGGYPTGISNLRFPGAYSGPNFYPYKKALISAGVQARAIKFRIEANDTVFIDAVAASDLVVSDSLIMKTANSVLKVNTTFADSAQVYNGVLPDDPRVPLKSVMKTRSGFIYTNAELQAMGMQDGDVITNIRMHLLARRSNGNPYKNLKIKYYWAAAGIGTNFSGNAYPAVVGPPAAAVTVFSGDVNASAFAGLGASGTIDLPLINGGIVFSTASNRKLVLEISYDNSGFPLTGSPLNSLTNEDMRFTQTQTDRHYTSWSYNSTNPAVPAGDIITYAPSPANVTATLAFAPLSGATSITVSTAAQANGFWPGMILTFPDCLAGKMVTSANGSNPITFTPALTASVACSTSATVIGSNQSSRTPGGLLTRPNLSFDFYRPYIKYPITVMGPAWTNNGNFIPANSIVTFGDGTAPNPSARIEGTQTTTFFDLKINNQNHVTLSSDIIIQDSLRLEIGRLKLNNRLASLERNAINSLTKNSGSLQADNDLLANNIAPFGRFRWNMGAVLGARVIPFANASGVDIPFDYEPTAGTNDVIFSTYSTSPANINIPSPTVSNIYGFNGTGWNTDGSALADRYYMIDNSAGSSGTAHMTFRYANTERAATNPGGVSAMRAQRWVNDSSAWEFPFQPNQTYTQGIPDQVRILDYAGFDQAMWWVIVGQATPLPVELLDFAAVQYKNKVKLKWSTSSEINSSHFIVERSLDNTDFSYIGRVESKGPSNNQLDYFTWDMNPVEGIQYYYLRQYDRDGRMESYGPVSAKFTTELFDIVTASVSSSEMGLTVVFSYDSNEPFNYKIIDMAGREVVAVERNPATPGMNVIDIDAQLAKGVYQVILQNSKKTVSRKFFY